MQVLDTVSWVGDGDDTDFFLAVERTFDLRPSPTLGPAVDDVRRGA